MKRVIVTLTAFVLFCGASYGQEKSTPNPNLTCFRPFIGAWKYEGKLTEDVPGMAKKGTAIVFTMSWRWILDKNAVEKSLRVDFQEGASYSEKTLFGWNAKEGKIVYGGIASEGTMYLGSITPDGKKLVSESTGTTSEGKDVAYQGEEIKTGKSTLTWQALHRSGGLVEGPSTKYELKRVVRPKKTR